MDRLDLPEGQHLPQFTDSRHRWRGRRGFRRALALTALGTVLPGAGLTRTRAARVGWVLLGVLVTSLAAAAWFLESRGVTTTALTVATSPSALERLELVAAGAGIVWSASIVATAALTRPAGLERARTAALAVFTAVMVAAVAAGSFTVAKVADTTRTTLLSVFSAPAPQPDSGSPALVGAGPKVVDNPDPWAQTPRVNVLLLGSDAGVGRIGTRTDSMIVASMETRTGRTTLISLPRNLQRFPLPPNSPLRTLYPSGFYGVPFCRHAAGDECMLNAIWTEASTYKAAHPEAYPGVAVPGRNELRAVISEILGLRIDHTVVVDLVGFERLIDVMGGIDINVKLGAAGRLPIGGHQDPTDPSRVIGNDGWFTAGPQHLGGHLALWYARARATDDDYARMGRQRCVIRALVHQVNPTRLLTEYADVAQIARDNIYTDIPAANLPAFVELMQRVQKASIRSIALTPANGIQTANPNLDRLRSLVHAAIQPPATASKSAGASSSATAGPSSGSAAPNRTPPSSSDDC